MRISWGTNTAQKGGPTTSRSGHGIDPYLMAASVDLARWTVDGQGVVFTSNLSGNWEAYRVGLPGPDGRPLWPHRLTFEGERVGEVHPAGNAQDRVLVLVDQGGDERWRLLEVGPGIRRDLDPGEGVMRHLAPPAPDGVTYALSSNRRHPEHFDLYLGRLDRQDPPVLLWSDAALRHPLGFSPDGRHLLVRERRPSKDECLWLLPVPSEAAQGGPPVLLAEGPAGEVSQFRSPAWAPDGRSLYVVSDAGREYAAAVRLPLGGKPMEPVYAPEADVEELTLSPDGRLLATVENRRGASVVVVHDLSAGGRRTVLEEGGVVHGLAWAPQGGRLLAVWDRPHRPPEVVVLEPGEEGRARLREVTAMPLGGLDPHALAVPREVRYRARDGLEVAAWLYLPPQGQPPHPAVWIVHGGPEAQARPGFDPVAQFLVGRGVAVVKPNVRGSTGYGRTFEHLDDRRLRLSAVDDLADGVMALTAREGLDPARQAVMGGSYGGYMTLATLTRHPDLWCAGVDIVGIANLVTFLEHTSPWRRPVREAEYGSLAEDRDFLVEASPIHALDRLKAPLMVIHGARDPRVPVGEAEQIVGALRRRGHPVEFLRYEDEGHGLTQLAHRREAYGRVAEFLCRAMGLN